MFTSYLKNAFRPSADSLEAEFRIFEGRGRFPCTRTRGDDTRRVANQCAVRMSVALNRAMGRDILTRYDRTDGCYHSARCCAARDLLDPQPTPHVTRAVSLKHYLANAGYRLVEIEDAAAISGANAKRGIIFFLELDGGTGSHIDCWNGDSYFNAYSGGRPPRADLPMFRQATRIEFCQLH